VTDRFVVTGSGRCGTTWISRALTRAGVPCGHEEVFHPGEVIWPEHLRADSSWVAVTKLDQVKVPVALMVRHPLAVVRSMVEIGFFAPWDSDNWFHGPLRAAFPFIYDWPSPQDRALEMWTTLTHVALGRAEMVLRLEHVTRDPALFGRFLAWAGSDPVHAEQALTEPPCNRHEESRARTGITYEPSWEDHDSHLAGRAVRLAAILGYRDGEG
jgi:hypothetical protein